MTRYEDFKRRDERRPDPLGTLGDLFKNLPALPPVKPDDETKESP